MVSNLLPVFDPELIFRKDSILNVRIAILCDVLDIVYCQVDRFSDPKSIRCLRKTEDCDSLVYGSLIRGLRKVGVWPKVDPNDITISIRSICADLENVKIGTFAEASGNSYCGQYQHHQCSIPSLHEEVKGIILSNPDPVLEAHRKHMKSQADLLDLD